MRICDICSHWSSNRLKWCEKSKKCCLALNSIESFKQHSDHNPLEIPSPNNHFDLHWEWIPKTPYSQKSWRILPYFLPWQHLNLSPVGHQGSRSPRKSPAFGAHLLFPNRSASLLLRWGDPGSWALWPLVRVQFGNILLSARVCEAAKGNWLGNYRVISSGRLK